MTFLQRLFSGDFRRAVACEAAGEYAEAARHYALAGERVKVALMHLLRAGRAASHAEEVECLRDAMRWADKGTPMRRRVARALGLAMLTRGQTQAVAGQKDRERIAEAAELLVEAGDFGSAGAAWELIGEDGNAARAYEQGGMVEKMEAALHRDERKRRAARTQKGAFEDYELYMAGGDRDGALAAIRLAVDSADDKGEYRRLLEDLEARRLAMWTATLRAKAAPVIACAVPTITIGRAETSHLQLRTVSVSRHHAEIGDGRRLRDLGSRTGTWIGGMPLVGELELRGDGRVRLGDDCELAFHAGATLELEVVRGLDSGTALLAAAPGARIDLAPRLGVAADVWFDGGRPFVEAHPGRSLRLNGVRVVGRAQLIRRDAFAVDDGEATVE